MSCKPKSAPLSCEFVQAFKAALAGNGARTISHLVPIRAPGALAPRTYMIQVSREPAGTYLATCAEMPDILVTAGEEDEAVMVAKLAILVRLHRGGSELPLSPR